MRKFDALVLGGGAAGLLCAIEAGKRGRRVAVLEHADRIGKKILISGGGRCNFSNLHCQPENFISANEHFAKSALARYTPADFIALVEKHRIPYHEKTLGQLFCDRSAQDIIDLLESECRAAGVQTFLPVSRRMLWYRDPPDASSGLERTEKSPGPADEHQGLESAHQERVSLDSEAALCRVSVAMTLKVKLCTGEDRENCLRSSARKDWRRGTAPPRFSRTFRLPSRKGIASA